ncbi:MAG: hypothetical protein LBI49_08360 [Nocardiopsaceae bacterium]|jgi:hypothetical protein|nr:hypothetical protein [Nocardiopsaceae bacterium]
MPVRCGDYLGDIEVAPRDGQTLGWCSVPGAPRARQITGMHAILLLRGARGELLRTRRTRADREHRDHLPQG